jgi:hypothetical protein
VASNAFLTFEQLDRLELQPDSLSLEPVPVVTAGPMDGARLATIR